MAGALDLITVDEAKASLFPGHPEVTQADDLLGDVVSAVSVYWQTWFGTNYARQAYTENRSGRGRRSIWSFHRPVEPTNPAPTVTENGTGLVVVTGWNPNADVSFDPATGEFRRLPGPTLLQSLAGNPTLPGRWSEGFLNVVLSYTGGYAVSAVPTDLKLLVKYCVGLVWKTLDTKRVGVAREQFGQGSLEFDKDLPDYYMRIANTYSRPMVPET